MKTVLFLLFLVTVFTTAHTQALGVVTANKASAFFQGQWYSVAIYGDNPKIAASNDTVCVVTNKAVFLFKNRQWSRLKTWDGDGRDINVTMSQGVIGITTTSFGYAFKNGQWYPERLSGTPKAITSKNGNLLLITSSNSYAFDKNTNKWHPLNGVPVEYTR